MSLNSRIKERREQIQMSLYEKKATPEEMNHLVRKYRRLDHIGQEHINSVLNWEYQRMRNLNDIQLQLSELTALTAEMHKSPQEKPHLDTYFHRLGEQE